MLTVASTQALGQWFPTEVTILSEEEFHEFKGCISQRRSVSECNACLLSVNRTRSIQNFEWSFKS